MDRSDPQWYRDAVIYQLHIKAFFDADNDGIGDFEGLIRKLDYVADLGVTAVWLLPFYPSPLRDDGYDIADYRNINPTYGAMRDFRRFVKEAHDRNIRVITELVVNHTSDQHPWFQRARRAKPGSKYRNYYVWSDTDQKYQGTRIIFLDTESSNWTWDPVAEAYYWHRFYSHQPDLNFDNPEVLDAIMKVLHFWLGMGVDGMRLDAVPYLCEREGTNNENLPETHEILRKIRAEVDKHYPDRMLLAEANQWPEDTQEYFGKGDECHMSFHFPLMPRMYMAVAQEDRHPITDIMRQTPEIPAGCQWAVFLRNHDELTLEMVTDKERDYLWDTYAGDRRMRINLGIRRRLSPLMEHDRRKIELLKGLLFSMPGTPVVYYGDEIGMGDNVYLGDRDGVRTPMQWSPDRNGGFSRADPARLYLPAIMDPVYGFNAVNVEAQQRDPSSLLNWTKRLIAVRQRHSAFGRGVLKFLYPGNRKVLAYLREHEGETILCVANLSRSAQAVELDLSEYDGRVPVEMLGRTAFPPIGSMTYLLTLSAYGFYWFLLADDSQMPDWHAPTPPALPDFRTLVMRDGDWGDLLSGRDGAQMQQDVLPDFLANQRWFAAKDAAVTDTVIRDSIPLGGPDGGYLLAQVDVSLGGGDRQLYQLPLAIAWGEDHVRLDGPLLPFTLSRVRQFRAIGALHDATVDTAFPLEILRGIRESRTVEGPDGEIAFVPAPSLESLVLADEPRTWRMSAEQSNTSVVIDDKAVLKVYRRLSKGIHPEVEIGRFLTEAAGYTNTPKVLGHVEHRAADGTPTALAILQEMVFSQGDAWSHTQDQLDRALEEAILTDEGLETFGERLAPLVAAMGQLGRRTAELHRALAMKTDRPDFGTEPITAEDIAGWRDALARQAEMAFDALAGTDPQRPEDKEAIDRLSGLRRAVDARIAAFADSPPTVVKTRLHGDFHLGQVLLVEGDFHILDFEGEPARSLEERRARSSPVKDVAGMVRSFDYAAWAAAETAAERYPDSRETLVELALGWRDHATASFLAAYRETIAGSPVWPKDPAAAQMLLDLFMLEKALYEICYEATNRPAWIGIPVRGTLGILDAGAEGD